MAVILLATRVLRSTRSFSLGATARRLGATLGLAVVAVVNVAPRRHSSAPPAVVLEPRPAPATGRIEGMVEISTSLTARRPQFRPYSDPGSGSLPPATPRDPVAAELRNVILYLEGDSTRLPRSASRADVQTRARIAQRDERFTPHVLAVVQGTPVDFPNEDDVFHNVFSLSRAAGPGGRGFDLGRYPRGESRSVAFNQPGVVQVFCHIHGDMSALVLALANPYFASPGEDHRFVIDDVPEGEYTIVGWHERIKPITRRVRVIAGQTASIDFNIPLPQGGSK